MIKGSKDLLAITSLYIEERGNHMWLADKWKDYEVIDCSQGEKLERWGKYTLVRDRKSTRLNSSHKVQYRMPSSA